MKIIHLQDELVCDLPNVEYCVTEYSRGESYSFGQAWVKFVGSDEIVLFDIWHEQDENAWGGLARNFELDDFFNSPECPSDTTVVEAVKSLI